MNYSDTLEYLFNRLPMYQRIGPAAYKNNLDNTLALARYLEHPEREFDSIHIAGTNGKGSVSHMLASVLQESGLKTALATSPHMKDFRERIRLNGRMVPRSWVSRFVNRHKGFMEGLQASFFEISIGMTFRYFADQKPDVAVVETGLGGRLDSTNILSPKLSVITNIGLDHTHLLGDSLESIAREKAGIIKPGTPVLIGRRQAGIHRVFEQKARDMNAPLYVAEDIIELSEYKKTVSSTLPLLPLLAGLPDGRQLRLNVSLTGDYQRENVRTVLAALWLFSGLDNNGFAWKDKPVTDGLRKISRNTGLRGRWQRLGRDPLIICDTAHNPDGVKTVTAQLQRLMHEKVDKAVHAGISTAGLPRLHIVLGMVNDKDTGQLLAHFPPDARYYFARPDVPRGLDARTLTAQAAGFSLCGEAYNSVAEALNQAKKMAAPRDVIFVGGSTFVVAEALP